MALKDQIPFGMSLPHRSPDAIGVDAVRAVAQRAEALGFRDLWVTENTLDHVTCLDPVVALTYAAAVTSRIRLGASVVVLAIHSPLIDHEVHGARGILLSISGGSDISLHEVNEAAEVVRAASDDQTNIIFGASVDEQLAGQMWVTVVATGFAAPGLAPARRPGTAAPAERTPAPPDDLLEPPSFVR